MNEVKAFLLTFSFFSRLNFFSPSTEEEFHQLFRKSLKYIPFFSFLSGGVLLYFWKLLFLFLPMPLPVFLLFAVQYFLFNYFHFDGFLDSIDALFSGKRKKKEILSIMEDTHRGSFAVLWGAFLIFFKISLLQVILPEFPESLFFMFSFGRFSMLSAVFVFPKPAKMHGLGYIFASQGRNPFIIPLFIFSSVLLPLSPLEFLSVLSMVILLSLYVVRKIGGFTGDTFGMICEASEVIYLVSFFIRINLLET